MCLPVAAVIAAGLVASAGRAVPGAPVLRSATASDGHVVVVFTVGDLQPWLIEVASSPGAEASGAFPPRTVRLQEMIRAQVDPATGLVRWRTRHALPARAYYVRVSGVETGGVTDCLPQQPNCLVHWSNTRRVLLRR
jgi:hypothetical protein